MEYRKLISFGKSSYVVSLPKNWVRRHNLVKGDLIYFDEQNNDLLLQPKKAETKVEEKEIVIPVDNKSVNWIAREVSSAYIQNYRKIILKGKEVKTKVKEFQTIIQYLIALEIMEQTSDTIVASDFLNMEKVSMEELIRKMDVVTRTMMKEALQIFKEKNISKTLGERDKDVDRLYFLLYRAVIYNLTNPSKLLKNFNLTTPDLLQIKFTGYYIENIADEIRRATKYAQKLKLSANEKKIIEHIFKKLDQYYVQTMKSIYNKNADLALELSESKKVFEKELEALDKQVTKIVGLHRVISHMGRMIKKIHSLGRLVYT